LVFPTVTTFTPHQLMFDSYQKLKFFYLVYQKLIYYEQHTPLNPLNRLIFLLVEVYGLQSKLFTEKPEKLALIGKTNSVVPKIGLHYKFVFYDF
jgi:hypothetical protein